MVSEDTLIVQPTPDGSWPPPEKWMQGYNERTGESGEFPGGAYVEFVEEIIVEPEPEPEPEPEVPVPSPRHGSNTDSGAPYNNAEPDESPPPPPPPRRSGGGSSGNIRNAQENHIRGPKAPKPMARTPRRSMDKASDRKHSWSSVTFRIPVLCSGCKSSI